MGNSHRRCQPNYYSGYTGYGGYGGNGGGYGGYGGWKFRFLNNLNLFIILKNIRR